MKKIFTLLASLLIAFSLNAQTNTFPTTGNTGIGTLNPAFNLDIFNNATTLLRLHRPNSALNSTTPVGIGFSHRGDANQPTGDTRAGIYSSYNGDLFFAAANGVTDLATSPFQYSRLFIEGTDGYIGIGTTNPTQLLHVKGNILSTNGTSAIILGHGIRANNRAELFLNAESSNDVSEIFFGYGPSYDETKIRWEFPIGELMTVS